MRSVFLAFLRRYVLATVSLMMGASVLSSCTYTLERLQETKPIASPFYQELSFLYSEFAESEKAQYDWFDSAYFADKGLRAAQGETIYPEELVYWNIPEEFTPPLTQAREQLTKALANRTYQDKSPEQLAKALFSFDCWVEQQEEAWQQDDISECRELHYQAMEDLVADEQDRGKKNDDMGDTKVSKNQYTNNVLLSYMIFYDVDKAKINKDGQDIIQKIVAEAKKHDSSYKLTINGHADRLGSAEHNMSISKDRAKMVEQAFLDAGLIKDQMATFAFGETDPKVPTKDNIANSANRRVEIILEY